MTTKKCIDEFASILSHIDFKKSEAIIAGDFNINLLKINEKEYCSEFYDTLTGFSFLPKITFPTRFSSLIGTLIDNLFCKKDKNSVSDPNKNYKIITEVLGNTCHTN